MRIFYPVKGFHLVMTLVCLAIVLRNKDLCAYKDPRTSLSQPARDCHTSLIQSAFGIEKSNVTDNKRSLLEDLEGFNGTTDEEPAPFDLRGCIRIYESDIYGRSAHLSPLLSVLLPVCLLIVEMFLIALQMARVLTSYHVPDQLSTVLSNLLHGACWLGTALALFLLRLCWEKEWAELSPDFIPTYPIDYFHAEEIAWVSVILLLLESTACHDAVYYNLKLEDERGRMEVEPPRIIATYRDSTRLLSN